MRKSLLTAAIAGLAIVACQVAVADLAINTTGTPTLITFDTTVVGSNAGPFSGTGLDPIPSTGRLDSNSWQISGLSAGDTMYGGTYTSGVYARGSSSGNVSGQFSEGIYSFNHASTGTDRSLGIQPGGADFTPGSLTLRVLNDTGSAITDFDIAYEIWFRNNQTAANSMNFSYSTDGMNFTHVNSMDFATLGSGTPFGGWESSTRASNVAVSLAAGQQLYLRWFGDQTGTGAGDEYALDDISITLNASAIPEPGAASLVAIGIVGMVVRRRRRA